MNYNMEVIAGIAQQLAESMKKIVQSTERGTQKQVSISDIERTMREMLREIGQQALGKLLSGLQSTPEREIACECGGKLAYQRMRPAKVISVFGKVEYERAYYAGCRCQTGRAPLDHQYGLEPGRVTSGLAALLALAGIAFSYDESPCWIEEFLLFEISENTIRSETEGMGALQAQREAELIEHFQQEKVLQQREQSPGKVIPRLYGSMDAAKVRTEPRPKRGAVKEAHEDWRDMKVLCWYEVEKVPGNQHATRHRAKVARQQPALRARNMRYFSDIIEAEAFGKLLWATGCLMNADLSPELIFLGDGAVWIWNLVEQYYPNAVQIVDWFHAEEHLEAVAEAAFSNATDRTTWLEPVTQALWEGQVELVIAACKTLAPDCLKAQQAVTYFTNNMERMRYDHFRANEYMIGSGTIESACKQVVTHRLALPGAQWHVSGAVYTAKARSAWLSGDWLSLCQKHSALPLAV